MSLPLSPTGDTGSAVNVRHITAMLSTLTACVMESLGGEAAGVSGPEQDKARPRRAARTHLRHVYAPSPNLQPAQ